jgi:hypothetical protein
MLNDRQGEGAGLAGARLGDAKKIASSQKLGNGAGLNGRRRGEGKRRQGALDRLAEPKRGKAVGRGGRNFSQKNLHAAQMLFGAVRVRAPRAMRSGTGKKKIVRKKMKPQAAPLSRMQPSDEDHRSRISRTITAP